MAADNLSGRVVVVTGAARGMGAAYVEAFLAAGAKVLGADRSWAGAETPAGDILCVDMDVTNDSQIDAAFEAAMTRFGTVDVLISNAAMRQRDLFPPSGHTTTLDTKDSDWERSFAVNVFGVLKVIRRFVRPMIEKKRGSIVTVASNGILAHSQGGAYVALRPNSREMPYMSAKAALATMSFYLADEIKEHNVAVNVVLPAHTRTTGFEEQARARLATGGKPGPVPVVPEHMVPLVMHLATQDASGVTGKMFDALVWNQEHGYGGYERWADRSVNYEALR